MLFKLQSFHRGWEVGGVGEALFRRVFPPCFNHHVVLTNYYFLCCDKNTRVRRKRGVIVSKSSAS